MVTQVHDRAKTRDWLERSKGRARLGDFSGGIQRGTGDTARHKDNYTDGQQFIKKNKKTPLDLFASEIFSLLRCGALKLSSSSHRERRSPSVFNGCGVHSDIHLLNSRVGGNLKKGVEGGRKQGI